MPPVLDALSVEERRPLLAMASVQGVFAAVPEHAEVDARTCPSCSPVWWQRC
jgi:hypothetical protein